MSMDRTVGDTFFIAFSTRAFATGIPTTLAGTPVVSAYEDAGLTEITAGITLGVDHDSKAGLNMLTIVATGANGFETGKDYNLVITTGTVDSVSVIGEVVGQFSLGLSAAAVDLANGTDGLGAIKADTAAILVDTADMQPKLGTPAADVSADIAAVKVDSAAILVDTAEIGTAGAGLTDLGGMSTGMKAEVNVEAKDVLFTDTDAEPAQGAPGATVSLSTKIGFLYKAWRNRSNQTATTYQLFNDDATTVDHKATVSDDATTAEKSEVATGP